MRLENLETCGKCPIDLASRQGDVIQQSGKTVSTVRGSGWVRSHLHRETRGP